ncbi:hypothetical protein [Leptobacterium sp. I13]|uniref:TlpA family protein disulfide reductase n=1 Tax=Leptobacterium meishanense TaxID=3128904 RepID=UPI0030EC6FAC
MKYVSIIGLLLILIGCNEEDSSVSFFGGEIINPNERYVTLLKDNVVIDSIQLDDNNRFFIKLNNPTEGIYVFKHYPESQYVIIEKGDSILMRLNTVEFDESLVFSGIGAEKNNFIVEMFLINEDEESQILDFYSLEANDFVKKMDSLKAMKWEQYENLLTNYTISENSKLIAKASIDFPYLDKMEMYPYMYKKYHKLDHIKKLPDQFYSYRKNINYNDAHLKTFRPYIYYLNVYFNNLSYKECKKSCHEEDYMVEETLHYHTHKLKMIDSVIKESKIKDYLFKNAAYAYMAKNYGSDKNSLFIKAFNKYGADVESNNDINRLHTFAQKLRPGNPIPKVSVLKADGSKIYVDSFIKNKNTVYYFWSMNQRKHMQKINKRINELRSSYPDHNFIGININEDHQKWLNTLHAFNFDQNANVQCVKFKEISEKLAIYGMNKAIIVKNDGTIINAFADVYHPHFEEQLKTIK